MSSSANLISLLRLVWHHLELDSADLAIVTDRAALYMADSDPYNDETAIFASAHMASPTRQHIKAAYDKTGARLWMLNPAVFTELGHR